MIDFAVSPPGDQVRRRLGQASGVRARSPGVRPMAAGASRPQPAGRARASPTGQRSAGGGRAGGGRPAGRARWSPFRRRLTLATLGGWPRRALAVACLLAAVVAGLHRPSPARDLGGGERAGVAVYVAAEDLAAGVTLTAGNVRAVTIPPDLVPTGAMRPTMGVVGRIVAGPMRRGEPLTDARLLGRGLTAGLSPPETVAVPVRLADAQTAALVRPGDRVDLLATPVDAGGGLPADPVEPAGPAGSGGSVPDGPAAAGPARRSAGSGSPLDATVLAAAVRVLAVLADSHAAAADGVLVVVAASDGVARRLAAAAAQERLSVALRPP